MKNISWHVAGIILLLIGACNSKPAKQEIQNFAKEKPGFTQDRTPDLADHLNFTDVTLESGIEFLHVNGAFGKKWMPETVGSGCGFLDYNNDGLQDILLVNSNDWSGQQTVSEKPSSKLYKNLGNGKFEDVTASAGLNIPVYGMGCTFADYDADGDIDIYLTAVGDNVLLRNDGGKFTNVTSQMKLEGNTPGEAHAAWSTGAVWCDVDRDGWLDLFVANYVKWTPETDIYVTRDGQTKSYATPDVYAGESCRLYKNLGGKGFKDITNESGVYNEEGKSLGIAIADFNHDRWPDFVVSNDTQPNFLYINNGDGTFKNMANIAGIGYDENGKARAGMGIDVADVKNDDKLAIAIGNFSQEPLSLYTQSTSAEVFQDRAGSMRLSRPSLLQLTFGLQFADLDLDGYQDLLTANGHIEPEINLVQKDITFAQVPQLFYNNKGSYIDVGEHAGKAFTIPIVGRGLAVADIDQDADLDILISTNAGKALLLRNDSDRKGKHLIVQLQGKKPNWQALGAKVEVWTEGNKQQRMLRTGSSYLSQSEVSGLFFGMGDYTQADSVLVYWPTSNEISRLTNVEANQRVVVKE